MDSRIYIEKFKKEDYSKYYLNLVLNEDIMIMNFGRIFTLKEAEESYSSMMEINDIHEECGSFKVFEKNTKDFMGMGALLVNNDITRVEIEYMILHKYWGKKYGTEIVTTLINKAEKVKTIKKITAIIDPQNIPSRKILLNNGFEITREFKNPDDGFLVQSLEKNIH